MAAFRIRIDHENLKFSSGHFVLFGNGKCETLHGHNYRAWVELEGALQPSDYVLDFLAVKPLMKEICERLDHHVLLPTENADLKIEPGDSVIGATYGKKRYSFPEEDVLLLPIHNTSAELLARYICRVLREEIKNRYGGDGVTMIRVGVQESFGQEASYEEAF
ncbi:MAG: 6-carboxytetrahydropterin synthase [bacterium]|uniref:6-carboxy-5,6,7,8-tetrahydropterin synthase n=1 Tax=Candidatus Methylomirabilis tolerans TaxID=3123416 RepID=A0AAJ1AJ35_9BACT|nr:6-carboxytetrahydropterin synthase [Candidatus Methylomirabilis sp.]